MVVRSTSKGLVVKILNYPEKSDLQMDLLVVSHKKYLTDGLYKIHCSVLNHRLTQLAEQNDILAEEQNGFRPNRSCTDHLITLTIIINTRKITRKSTFIGFVDFSKAYDKINRNLLWHKLEMLSCL